MYPYVDVISKTAYDILTENGQRTDVLDVYEFDYEIVNETEILDKLFGHAIIMQSHLIEVFAVNNLPIDEMVITDPDVEEVPGYKNITDLLNESFSLMDIPYKYPLKLYVPENIKIEPYRIEYAYVNASLIFSFAISLYKTATIFFESCDQVVLLKKKGGND